MLLLVALFSSDKISDKVNVKLLNFNIIKLSLTHGHGTGSLHRPLR